jgi:hypothetical protein
VRTQRGSIVPSYRRLWLMVGLHTRWMRLKLWKKDRRMYTLPLALIVGLMVVAGGDCGMYEIG